MYSGPYHCTLQEMYLYSSYFNVIPNDVIIVMELELRTTAGYYHYSFLFFRAIQNRLILVTIIVIEIFVLFGVLTYKLYKKFD